MNLTELLATPVIHLQTAAKVGVVCAFHYDEQQKRVTHLSVVDEDSYLRELYYRIEDVNWGENVLFTDVEPLPSAPPRIPFRGQIFDTDGVDYGYLKEITCTKGGQITALCTTNDEIISPKRILRIGDVVLLKGKTVKKAKEKRESRESNDEASQQDERVRPFFNEPKESGLKRIAGDYSFLLGRKIREDLTHQGETILKRDSVITGETIDVARQKGLLLSLTEISR